ncbi:MAG TPA: hypothetical protein ENG16_00520, partial [Archaeoglobus sp.]|nr:hypothetical protein [Archaeoglobus sp.]
MKIKFLGTGPTNPIPRPGCNCDLCKEARKPNSKSRRLSSSLLIDDNILIDATPYIEEQLKPEELKSIEYVLITHAHSDAVDGLDKVDKPDLKIYSLPHTLDIIKLKFPNLQAELIEVKPLKAIRVGKYNAMPIPVEHAVLTPKFDPTLAWKIGRILYAEDVDEDFFFSDRARHLKNAISNSEIVILDGAMCKGKLRGHLNIWHVVNELLRLKPHELYFTQIGHSCPPHEQLEKELKEYGFKVAYDGLVLETKNLAHETKEGLYLVPRHARMIYEGT